KAYHADGFSSPVGRLKGHHKGIEDFSSEELQQAGIEKGRRTTLEFQSGITVTGLVEDLLIRQGNLLAVTFSDCTVSDEHGRTYFEPSWGRYDMAVGDRIISVFCGAADKDAFEEIALVSQTRTMHPVFTEEEKAYQELFRIVRECREQASGHERLPEVWSCLKSDFREDWLCALEVLEILRQENLYPETAREITIYLELKASSEPEYAKLIKDGFHLIEHPVAQLDTTD
ncbi:MAG TPA: phenylalanine 4-monooxygenase, partial [Sphingobacteriaceae bacterium]